jgi:CheY-like chemotaxis protein
MSDATTVLLVDDDLDCRTIFSRALSHAGYRVMDAATGARAMDIARTAAPTVCIVDLGLPDLDGLEVTRALRANPSTCRAFIVILTAYVSDLDVVQHDKPDVISTSASRFYHAISLVSSMARSAG